MANGDAAAAAGMDVVASTDDRRDGYDEINKTRDYIAQRTSAVQPVNKGGTGATTAASARTNLGINWGNLSGKPSAFPPSSHEHERIFKNGHQLYLTENGTMSHYVGATRIFGWSSEGVMNAGEVPATRLTGTVDRPVSTSGGGRFGAAWGNNITSERRAVWMEADGTLGHTASSERYKKNIQPAPALTDAQFAALQVVTFQWRAAVSAGDHMEVGMIAEHLDALGLEWAVFYDEQGQPEGIHYDRIVLAVIPYVQQLAARVEALEAKEQ